MSELPPKDTEVVEKSHYRRSAVNRPRLMDGGVRIDDFENVHVAIYVRVSKEEQLNGYSIEAQKNICRQFCKERNWQIIEIYEEPGLSAKDDNRPEFQRMITDAQEQKFNTVLIHKLDRFSRSIDNTLHYFKVLSDCEVALTSVAEKFDFSSAQGRLFFRMMAIFAQWYLENLSSEAVKGKEEMFRQGKHNAAPPFGYVRVQPGKEIQIVPEEAEAVRLAFECAATGSYTHKRISEMLNKRFKTRRGNNWSKDTVKNMLQNEFYFGMVAHLDEIRPGRHEAIISRELYEKAQDATRQRARMPRNLLFQKHSNQDKPTVITEEQPAYYLLQRIIRCDHCERHLRIQGAKGYRYYREVSAERGQACDLQRHGVRMDIMDQVVLDLLSGLKLPENWQAEIVRRAKDKDVIAMTKARKADLEDKIRRLDNVYLNGAYEHKNYLEQREKLLEELNRLVIPNQASSLEQGMVLNNLGAFIEKATPAQKNDICRTIMDSIYTDFNPAKYITRFKPAPVFIDLFRLAGKESGWEEKENGEFILI